METNKFKIGDRAYCPNYNTYGKIVAFIKYGKEALIIRDDKDGHDGLCGWDLTDEHGTFIPNKQILENAEHYWYVETATLEKV